jgi:threonine dehydrogenase-like Zn-dependent dehydrogenase
VINNSGPQSILEDIGFLCGRGGTISLVGCLEGFDADWDPKRLMELIAKSAKLKYVALNSFERKILNTNCQRFHRGVIMGSKADFEDMNRFLEEREVKLSPALDRVFPFSASKNAFDYLKSGKHTGKVVIKME